MHTPDAAARLQRFLEEGGLVLDVGIRPDDVERRRPLWSKGVLWSAGLHPNFCGEEPHLDGEELRRVLKLGSSAVGETGLDFYRSPHTEALQREWFRIHLELSRELDLPVVIHCRDAEEAVLEELRARPPAGGVWHCFSGGWEVAKRCLDLGLYLSFAGNVTYANQDDLLEVVRRVPADRWLVETDAPYLAPQPVRGRKNHPDFVVHTVRFVAGVRGLSEGEALLQARENFLRLFSRRGG